MYAPIPLPVFLLLIACFIVHLVKTRPKSRYNKPVKELLEDLNTPAPTPPTERELENIREMKRIVAKYEGYTAEVFDATVFGRKKV